MAVKAQERADLANELLEQIGQTVGQKANVSSVFGEPIEREGLTVIPVAKDPNALRNSAWLTVIAANFPPADR